MEICHTGLIIHGKVPSIPDEIPEEIVEEMEEGLNCENGVIGDGNDIVGTEHGRTLSN